MGATQRQLMISDAEFVRISTFIHKNYGIDLTKKKQLISSRLSNVVQREGFSDFSSYIDNIIKNNNPDDIETLLNHLTTNYTFFMREPEHFTFFKERVLPEISKKNERTKSLAIWSAGCSSGEEPYTLSIYLKEYFGINANNWDTRILATDISNRALTKAQAGEYPKPKDMPSEWVKKYFSYDNKTELYKVSPQLRNNVIFQTFNLMGPINFKVKFDVIFCRNVMIYFDQETRDALVDRYYNALKPGGILFISHSESLGRTNKFETLRPAVYRKK